MAQTVNVNFTPVNLASRKNLDMKAGDTVKVYSKIQEKGKTRLQAFEGVVLARKHGGEPGATFTVRKVASGVGVERVFPLYSPMIDRIEIIKRSKTRRSKLYFIREKAAKEIRKRMKAFAFAQSSVDFIEEEPEVVEEIAEETEAIPEMAAEETPVEATAEEAAPEEKTEEVPAETTEEETKSE
ncbi:50S ribosomal protein L19 [Candidatus Nomurabacteria bacterium]|nr:50S ribosomal protein L19 [Candidatus Nomurabacteria bacterium]